MSSGGEALVTMDRAVPKGSLHWWGAMLSSTWRDDGTNRVYSLQWVPDHVPIIRGVTVPDIGGYGLLRGHFWWSRFSFDPCLLDHLRGW